MVITVLIEREAARRVIEVDGQHVGAAQCEQILVCLFRVKPMPAIELNAKVAGPDGNQQLLHFAHAVEEGLPLAAPQGARRNVFQTEFLTMIGENLRALAQPAGVLAEVLRIGELVTARQNPSANPRDSGFLEDGGRQREFSQPVAKRLLVLAELDRQAGRAESEILGPQVIQEPTEPSVAEGCKIGWIRVQTFETVLDREL